MFITLIVFLIILGVLVFVHEFGHYWVAKRSGVPVHEFAFGFGPRLYGWKRNHTLYAINAIPLGGYVKLEGELEDSGKKGSFVKQPIPIRMAVLVAGVVMNLILAWVLLTITYGIGSYPLSPSFENHRGVTSLPRVVVSSVIPDSPASYAGLKSGDVITNFAGEAIDSPQKLMDATKANAGEEVKMRYLRGGEETEVTVTSRANPPMGQGALGITMGQTVFAKTTWAQAPIVALKEVKSQAIGAFTGFAQFVGNLVAKQEVSDDVSGIVGIGAATGFVRKLGIAPLLQFTALISTNLAVINILPILPLDGGHLLFVIIEAIRRKPVEMKYRQWVSLAGLAAILLLFLVVTYQDILRFFS